MEPTPAAFVALIPLLPLAGALVLGFAGPTIQARHGERAIGAIACASVAAAFLLSVVAFVRLVGMEPAQRLLLANLFPWIHVGALQVDVAFAVDPLSAVMILVVTGIGGLIHVYATGYMHGDQAFWRFFAYLNLFTFAMLTLVLGDSLLLLFVGWEGVGLCSWGLIGFWHTETANAQAGNKAFIVNRIGDFGFIVGIFLLFWSLDAAGHATLTFRDMVHHVDVLEGQALWGWPVATLITLFLFVGATGKSAQIPLYVWLPDAMAGPTPVSALIHAATMVTAGVYMVARMSFLFALAPATLAVVATIGALTALLAATIALTQTDIKKVLAYSTVSQLGYMFLALGVGAYGAAIFHLMTHAFFKACLFLGSGSVIHAMHHEQDMRKMGGLKDYMPATSKTFMVSALALAGIPPLAGFFSKDEILAKTFQHGPLALWGVGVVVAGLTAFYMSRQVFMVFFGECRADEHTKAHLHESPASMTVPLWILMGGAVVTGFLWIPPALGGFLPFEHWLDPVLAHGGGHGGHGGHAEHLPIATELGLMALSVGVALGGIGLGWLMYYQGTIRPETFSEAAGGWPYRASLNKYWVDELYDVVFVGAFARWGARALAWFDGHVIDAVVNGAATLTRMTSTLNGLIDHYLVDGLVNFVADATRSIGAGARRLQTGAITAYLYVVALGVAGGVALFWSWANAAG
jgi:NADH-quinone oxidoreductase subunit L